MASQFLTKAQHFRFENSGTLPNGTHWDSWSKVTKVIDVYSGLNCVWDVWDLWDVWDVWGPGVQVNLARIW